MSEIKRPERSSSQGTQTGNYRPDQLNPELAAARQADILIEQAGAPMILDKKFVVWQGIFTGLNHTEKNKTGYDASIRMAIYGSVGKNSVNIGGRYFEKVWSFPWIKAAQIYPGMMGNGFEKPEEGQSAISRLWGWITGKNKQQSNGGQA